MGNPYAPKRQARSVELGDPLTMVLARLRRCGADDEDLANVREGWPPEPEVIEWLLNSTDEDLRAEIARVQEEYDYATRTEDEQAIYDAVAHLAEAERQVAKELGRNVASAVAWIGDDPIRAQVALDFETSDLGSGRKGVKDHAAKVIDANA